MSQASNENLTGHNYDGIQEYDNPTPAWWTWMFLATILYAFVYGLFMILGGNAIAPKGFYERASVEALKLQYGQLGTLQPDSATLLRLGSDEKWRKVGASIFASNCASCHGMDASGIVAPNLTDNYAINLKKIEDIVDVVANGRKNGAMPAWVNRLLPVEQILVSSYVATLQGKNLPSAGGRPAEGLEVPPWEASGVASPSAPVVPAK